jgi:hypothetical protein
LKQLKKLGSKEVEPEEGVFRVRIFPYRK